jgi:hypothetical protein
MSEHVLRFLLWRMLGLFAAIACAGLVSWFLGGGPGQLLRARRGVHAAEIAPGALASSAGGDAAAVWGWEPVGGIAVLRLAVAVAVAAAILIALSRGHARHRRRYRRLIVAPYRGDHADADALLRMFEGVLYVAAAEVRRPLERAIAAAQAADRITLLAPSGLGLDCSSDAAPESHPH